MLDRKKKDERDNRYKKEHYDRVTILAPKGYKDELQKDAQRAGKSVTRFCMDAIAYYREALK